MENELIVRLVECAKPLQSTTDVVGWEDTTSIPKKGEICLEYYTETSAGDIDYGKVCYKMKIGDGVNTYANLPYFPTTKDINAKIAAWVNAHLNATDYAQASIDTTTKTLTIQGIGETGGIIHQAESFALQFVEGNKIDITVQKSNNLSSTVTIAHEATTTTESTGTKREFGGSVVTGLTLDSMGHIINIEKSALPDNPVDANTVTASNNLPENEVVLGNGTKTIKSSGKTITTTTPTSTSTDSTIPTSKAVDTAIDTKINALDSGVNAGTNKVLTGVTQSDGKLTAKADVSYTDIAPVQNVKSGNHITVSSSDNEYTVNHAAIGTGSAITPTTDGNTGWEGDVITTVERDTYGHISGVKTKKIPTNPVSAGSTTTNQLMKSDGDNTTSPSGFAASNSSISESGSDNATTLPTTSAIVTYVQNKMGDLAGALIYKGTVNSASDLPTTPSTGWTYVVATAGTYAGKACEIGDYLIYNGSSWDVVNGENQVDDKNATLPWNTQTTIAEVDGTAIHVTLPENPVNSLDATNKGAASISGSTITIKAVSQNNGLIADGDSTTINLDGTYDATNNKLATVSTVSNAVNALDVANDKGAASISGSTITINAVQQENGLIKDGGSTTINLDGTYGATDNKIATQSTVSNAIADLDVNAYSQATVNTTDVQGQTTLTIKGIKEVNGKIAADNTTNIKTDILIDGTYSNNNKLATQSTVDTAINDLDESADIGAMTFDTTEQSITVKAVQQEDGKIKDGGSTVIKLGDGLTATVDTSNNNVVSVDSDSIVAGDIKDPDIHSDNNDWNYRQTANGSTEAAGTDVAKLNPLKGNTIVWNQLVQNGNFVNSEGWYKDGASATFTVSDGVATFTAGEQYQYISYRTDKAISTHRYLLSIDVKRASDNSVSYSFGIGSGGTYTAEGLYTVIPLSSTSTTNFTRISKIGTFNKAEGYIQPQFIIMQMRGPHDAIMIKNVQLIDLTKLFGLDEQICAALGVPNLTDSTNLTKAAENFEKLFPLPYYNYNEGELISLNPTGIKSVGFNQWDEEWENATWNPSTGQKNSYANWVCSDKIFEVVPNTTYYIKFPVGSAGYLYYWNDSKTQAERIYIPESSTFIPSTRYFSFAINNLTQYNHDICINISDSSRNGTYEPYKKYTLDLDWIKTLKLNDELLFPYGLCSAGSVYDEVGEDYAIKRVGAVDMSLLTYLTSSQVTNGFVATVPGIKQLPEGSGASALIPNVETPRYVTTSFDRLNNKEICYRQAFGSTTGIFIKDNDFSGYTPTQVATALSGVMLYYELATPITIHFNKKSMYYVVDDKGTEQLLPVNDADPVTAPIRGQVDYHSNIKEVVKDLIGTSSGDTYTLTSNKASSSSTNDASITLTDSNGNKQSITVPFSAIRNDENITIILNGNF